MSLPALLAAIATSAGLAVTLPMAGGSPAPPADAAPPEPSTIVVEGGVTQPVFSYADAIRQTVQVRSPVSSHDGDEPDMLTVDIIRPAASDGELRVPTIIHASPYFLGPFANNRYDEVKPAPARTTVLRMLGEHVSAVSQLDFFPRYYDNYFVPRGYAVALVDMAGSRASTGCLDVGGPAEIDGTAAVVEWLAGDGYAVDVDGEEVTAEWSNGLSAMIGKSWDGTVPNGVATRAPEGLATIVPLVGLTHWHSDFWTNGTRYGGSPTLWHDRHSDNPAMEGQCTTTRGQLAANQDDPDPNTDFWQQRDFVKDAGDVEASVFVVSAVNDYNVKPANFARWWDALSAHDVARRLWLSQVAHEEPFDFRREEWVDAIHRWFDHWLHGIDNEVMDEPEVEVEHGPGEWTAYDDWPNGSTATRLWLGQPDDPEDPQPGTLRIDGPDPGAIAGFVEARRSIAQLAAAPFQQDDRRLVFLTPELSQPLHVSGETSVTLDVRIGGENAENATFTALLVDYGAAERVNHAVEGGIRELDTQTCFGDGTVADTGCYPDVELRTHTADFEVVTRGWAQAGFVLGLPSLDPEETYRLSWALQPHDYVFETGHRIGIVLAGPETHLNAARHPTTNRNIEVDLGPSRVRLPVVGGVPALRTALGFSGS